MTVLGLATQQWINLGISFAIIAVAVVVGRWLVTLLLDRIIGRLVGKTATRLDNLILDAVRQPVYWLAVAFAFDAAFSRLDFLPETWDKPIADTLFIAYMLVGFTFVIRLFSGLFDWYSQDVARRTETDIDRTILPFLRRIAVIIISVIGIITVLSHFEVDVSALVATLGIGSLAIALAAQAALDDTISGFIIITDQPYRIGDRIEILDLDTWGDVVDIGLRSTRIVSEDNRMIVVPNSVIGKSLVVNHSYPNTQYRIEVPVGVAYGTDIEHARRVIVEAVKGVEGVVPDRPVEALFHEFADSALVFNVRWWIEFAVERPQMFDRVNTAIYAALNEAGIEIPFPQRDVNHKIDPAYAAEIARAVRQKGS
jgi:MscS family membrane protein